MVETSALLSRSGRLLRKVDRSRRRNARLRLQYEILESRHLLAAGIPIESDAFSPPASTPSAAIISWFESFDQVPRIPFTELSGTRQNDDPAFIGPRELVAGEWIVQLTEDASRSLRDLAVAGDLLENGHTHFTVISGLGQRGLILVRGEGVTHADIEANLTRSAIVSSFGLNQLIQGQETTPNDTDIALGLLPGLESIGGMTAWDESIGSLNTVVAVLDTGIDLAHRDLYLNIWFNQGEIPSRFLDNVGTKLVDIDNDGLITFYDLNHATRSTTAPFELTVAGFANGPNAEFVRDLNGNGYIDGLDILQDPFWADGRDTDGNGEVDDFFGVNFRGDGVRNNPSDRQGHGTHVSGTIGAIGGNNSGIAGVNWQTSLMPLRILDDSNQGDIGAAIRAVNYAAMMRERYQINENGRVITGANVRVLNNSWGQPGGYDAALAATIEDSGDAGILFVAAAGNGNFLGLGVDNDRTPFYPASYDANNVLAVAAGTFDDGLAPFSNFGDQSVDLAAPGIGIRSTELGGGYGTRNGTSMATPHVSGTAALIWSALPAATVAEVKEAILSSVTVVPELNGVVATGGRLDAAAAINANVFAPSARVIAAQNVTTSGGSSTEFTVEYFHRSGFDAAAVEAAELLVTRQWGYGDQLIPELKPGSIVISGETASATYVVEAPGIGPFDGPAASVQGITYFFPNTSEVPIDPNSINQVTSQILVSSVPDDVSLTVGVEIEHTYTGDLTATLIAPDGSRSVLFSRIGGSADNFTGTRFNDSAAESITTAAAPFTGIFRPQERLMPSLAGGPNGDWTLEIRDSSGISGGRLVEWWLEFSPKLTSRVYLDDLTQSAGDFDVSMSLVYPNAGNLSATLVAPNGMRYVLFSGVTGSDIQFADARFSNASSSILMEANAPFEGTYRPQQDIPALSISALSGAWTLELTDERPLDGIELLDWSLQVPGGGIWDALDYGDYVIHTVEGSLLAKDGSRTAEEAIGSFNVRILDDPSVIYVNTSLDSPGEGSLRDAVLAANASGSPKTIILDSGTYTLQIPPVIDSNSSFPEVRGFPGIAKTQSSWSNGTTGDLTVESDITIVGSQNLNTVIDASELDRVFRVFPDAKLTLRNLAIQNGVTESIGGNILAMGDVDMDLVIIRDGQAGMGGGIAALGGNASIGRTRVTQNTSSYGAVYVTGFASANLFQSTVDANTGGGLQASSINDVIIESSTFSGNRGGSGAVARGYAGNFSDSFSPSISADGRFLAFVTVASNLVPADNNDSHDIFIYDREEGQVERVSINNAGEEGNDSSHSPAISADGRFVAFDSYASNLVLGDDNGMSDVFVYDRLDGQVERVSISDAEEEGDSHSFSPSISADGRFVTFISDASNLVPNDNNGSLDVFVYDRATGRIERISINNAGEEGDLDSYEASSPSITADGRFVTFESYASNLVPDDGNSSLDVFVYDRREGQLERVSISDAGEEGDWDSSSPTISGDGRYVTFVSLATNLIPQDINDSSDVFVYDRELDKIERVSVYQDGGDAYGSSYSPRISANGRFIAFRSKAQLFEDYQFGDVFLYDSQEKRIEPISKEETDYSADLLSDSLAISDDGHFVAFESLAPHKPSGDAYHTTDIFVYNSNNKTIDIPIPVLGDLSVHSSTFANTADAPRTIVGDTLVVNSLFSGNVVEIDFDSSFVESDFNLRLPDSDRDLLGPLASSAPLPPSHALIFPNPAIDSGDARIEGSTDQLGRLRSIPDVGAVEAVEARITGIAFADLNGNATRDASEPTLNSVLLSLTSKVEDSLRLSLDVDDTGRFIAPTLEPSEYALLPHAIGEWQISSTPLSAIRGSAAPSNGPSSSPDISADGRFVTFASQATNLVPSDVLATFDVFVYDRKEDRIEIVSINDAGEPGNHAFSGVKPTISGDGGFVAFESEATNLFPGDTLIDRDIFVFDRVAGRIELVSINSDGEKGNFSSDSSISADGRFVAFDSLATNLAPGDNNGINGSDIFVFDRLEGQIERVSISDAGEGGNQSSWSPKISGDGRFVAFQSDATNLIPTEPVGGIFVYDRQEHRLERVNLNNSGDIANARSLLHAISADGRFVVFASLANNLVSDDNNGADDVFVYDRQEDRIERISVSSSGSEGNGSSQVADISADGRFVVFESNASNLVSGDTNDCTDVFVYDRVASRIERISVNDLGVEGNDSSRSPTISANGLSIAFVSDATNLIADDRNSKRDIFLAPNPFLPGVLNLVVRAGEAISDVEIGLTPNPGALSGRSFQDTIIPNGVYDLGEPVLAGQTVFLDANRNGLLDRDETKTVTDSKGIYRFADVPAYREHVLVTATPPGFEQVVPPRESRPGFTVFLPAGGDLQELDFGYRPITIIGQSSDSTIRGRVVIDSNGNGVIDGGDTPVAGRVVYMDAGNLGVRDFDDPQAVTDSDGYYQFEGLPSTVTPLRVILDETIEQVSPLGSQFSLEKFPLKDREKREGNPQAVVTGDFNQDTFLDVAIVLAETNTLSIRLNDQQGGFLSRRIDLNLNQLAGGGTSFLQPTAIVVSNLDNDPRVDVAVTGNFTSNVLVLRNFEVASGAFGGMQLVPVGTEPLDLVAGQFGGDGAIDLVVLNKGESQLQVLTNNGSGTFGGAAGVATGGVLPSSIAAADFTGDGRTDIAVTHSVTSLSDVTKGRVTLLAGDGSGGLSLRPGSYAVQSSPQDSAVGDFNGDGRPDLAIVNFLSQSISVLLGQSDSTLRVQNEILGTTEGAVDVAVGDIDNDGDDDIVAGKLQRREVAIFRNVGIDAVSGDVRFEPQESIGLGQFSFAERMPFALANLDRDSSGPGGSGTLDIVAVPQNTDTLYVLQNTLVQGSRRASVSGELADVAVGNDFLLRPAILPPLFDVIADPPSILEDAAEQSVSITGIKKGRTTGPPIRFSVLSSNPAVISAPVVDFVAGNTQATIRYTPAANVNGTSLITVRAVDAGADELFGGPDDGIFERSFTITVQPVNDPPTFTMPASITVAEDTGPRTISTFVTGIGPGGGGDETTQGLLGFVISTNNGFFASPPAIDAQGRLTFTTANNVSGNVTVNVSLSDNGGKPNGGSDTKTSAFVISILPVNDAPSITIGGDQSAVEGSGQQTVPNFASQFVPGIGDDEASQVISDFVVSNDNPSLFLVQPEISTDGTLTYTPNTFADGSARVIVRVRDSGGTARGGTDLSLPQTFVIQVTPESDNEPPTPTITSNQPNLTNQTSFDVFVDFGEAVVGFTEQDLSVTGATAGTVVDLGQGSYRVPITTSADGVILIALQAGRVTDIAGNPNTAASPLTIEVDRSALVPTLQTGAPMYLASDSFSVSIDFGESVTGFELEDLTLINGTASNFADLGSGRFSATITAIQEGDVLALVPSSAAKDQAGNESKSSALLTIHVDRTSPTPLLSSLDPSPTKPAQFNVEVDFGEVVTGFETSDLVLSSGQVSAFSDRGNGRYIVTLSNLAEGAFSLSLPANAAIDLAGNSSLAATDLTVTVEIVNPDAIILEGNGNTFFLNQLGASLDAVQLIDIRGTGDNTLMLDADRIANTFTGGQILVLSNSGDDVVFDPGWRFDHAFVDGGRLVRQFVNARAVLNLVGPDDFTNPINLFDVNASGDVTALDALQVINELGRRAFSDGTSIPPGQIRDVRQINLSGFRFHDVSMDGRISALDALRVINEVGRRSNGSSGEEVWIAVEPARQDQREARVTATQAEMASPPSKVVNIGFSYRTDLVQHPQWEQAEGNDSEQLAYELVDQAIEDMFLEARSW